MHRFARFLALSRSQKRLLVHALIALPLCVASLKVTGFRRLHAILARSAPLDGRPAAETSGAGRDTVAMTVWAVRVAARHGLTRGHCLEQSLALWWLLRWQHLDSSIRFGARRQDSKLEAHAWVEFDGDPLLSVDLEDDPAFAPFAHAPVPYDRRQ